MTGSRADTPIPNASAEGRGAFRTMMPCHNSSLPATVKGARVRAGGSMGFYRPDISRRRGGRVLLVGYPSHIISKTQVSERPRRKHVPIVASSPNFGTLPISERWSLQGAPTAPLGELTHAVR